MNKKENRKHDGVDITNLELVVLIFIKNAIVSLFYIHCVSGIHGINVPKYDLFVLIVEI